MSTISYDKFRAIKLLLLDNQHLGPTTADKYIYSATVWRVTFSSWIFSSTTTSVLMEKWCPIRVITLPRCSPEQVDTPRLQSVQVVSHTLCRCSVERAVRTRHIARKKSCKTLNEEHGSATAMRIKEYTNWMGGGDLLHRMLHGNNDYWVNCRLRGRFNPTLWMNEWMNKMNE
jgi:hypothetical protein